MSCDNCGYIWRVPAGMPESVLECSMCELPVCACGCGGDLSPMREGARFTDRSHAERLRRAEGGEPRATKSHITSTHPLDDVRSEQDQAKSRWSAIVREGVIQALIADRDGFHADDLESLGIPDEHRNVIGSQIAKLVKEGCIQECGRRKSRHSSRNGAKSNVYRMTALGWQKFVGVGAGVRDVTSAHSGERGVGTPIESRDPLPSGSAPPSSDSAPPIPMFGVAPTHDQAAA